MSLLSRLFGNSRSEPVRSTASQPDAPTPSPQVPDPDTRAQEEERLSQAIAAGDLPAIGRWVLEGHSTRIRQRAAQAIWDPDQLYELIRVTRHGSDKSVYRILTAKRDERLAEIRRAEQLQADLQSAADAIARHAERSYDAGYAATLDQLRARWQGLETQASPELRHEVSRQLERAHAVIEQQRETLQAEAVQRRTAAIAAEQARQRRELQLQSAASVAAEEAQRRDAELAAEQAAAESRRAAEAAAARELVSLLRQAQGALDRGGTARAARLREAIEQKLPQAPAPPPWFGRQLQTLDTRLQELKDWKTFRVVPKRAELTERMQALIGADQSPEELAQHIRQLRQEWRSLHRGAAVEPGPEWQQFEDAAERAYAPCREHFARQAAQRKENQVRREALLERLTAFAAEQPAEQPDLQAIRHVVFEARQEWRACSPVEQAAVKPLQDRFYGLLKRLQAPLEAEYARNVQARRELIARAAELTTLEDTRQAIDESKRLQRAWKGIGIVPRKQDNALWMEFRRHCDAVFERGAHESAAHAAEAEVNVARAAALCEQLEQMTGLNGEVLSSVARRRDELNEQFEALQLPRAAARSIRQRFARALDLCDGALRRQHAAAAHQSWTDVFAAAGSIQAYALAIADGRASGDCEALREIAVAAVNDLPDSRKDAQSRLAEQLGAITSGQAGLDLPGNEAALRLLCVRAELTAGLATPAEDGELRREYQMQRLVESMGHGRQAGLASLDDLALEWISVGPVQPTAYDTLFARFERCREAGLA